MGSTVLKCILVSVLLSVCVACTHSSGLRHKQVKMLQNNGFEFTNEGWSLAVPDRLIFKFDSIDVDKDKENLLKNLAKNLHSFELDQLKVIGHTDNVGTAEYNQKLSEQRAKSVAEILVKYGFSADKIEVLGRGMTQPLYENDTEEHRAENRRVTIIIVP